MKDLIFLFFDLLTTLAKLLRPGGGRAVVAENLLLKQQLIIHNRSTQRAPNLSAQDRALLGFWSLFLNPRRIARSATIIKPSTEIIPDTAGQALNAIVDMKRRNSRFGCPRVAQQINLAFDLDLDRDTVRRVLAIHYKPEPDNRGQSWLTTLGHAKDSLWSEQRERSSISTSTDGKGTVVDYFNCLLLPEARIRQGQAEAYCVADATSRSASSRPRNCWPLSSAARSSFFASANLPRANKVAPRW